MRPVSSPARRAPLLANTTPVWQRAWLAVATSEEVPDSEPVQVLAAGQAWVLTRMDGTLTAFEDTCPHRGSPLSAGEVTCAADGSARLTCAFHGWRFDAAGNCDLQPGAGRHHDGNGGGHQHHFHWPHQRHGRQVTLRTPWGLAERYGLVWLAIEEPLAALPEFPEWEASAASARVAAQVVRSAASAGQVIDAFLAAGPLDFAEVTSDGTQVRGTARHRYQVTRTAGPHATVHARLELPHLTAAVLVTCQPEDLRTTRLYALGARVGSGAGPAGDDVQAAAAEAFGAADVAGIEADLAAVDRGPAAQLDLEAPGGQPPPLVAAWRQLMARAISS